MTRLTSVFALIAALGAAPAMAASVNTTLNFAKNNTPLDGQGSSFGFDQSTTLNVGIANLGFGAKASTGDVDASATIGFNTSFGDTVALADSGSVGVNMSLNSLNFGYNTLIGANAFASVDFFTFAGINAPKFNVIDEGYSLATSDSRSGFGSTGEDRDTEEIAGVGPNLDIGLGLRSQVTLDASQTSTFQVTDLVGTVLATHESGATATDTFSLVNDSLADLNLGLSGMWDLTLQSVSLTNLFDTALGISAGYELGVAVGLGCGDYSKDSDNGIFCVADAGVSGDSSQLNLSNPSAFAINWGTKSVSLGKITVLSAPVDVVPLPAGLPLVLTGLAGFALLRRRGS